MCVYFFFVKNNYGNGMRRWYSIYNIHESEFDGLNRCWYNDDAVMFQFQTIFANYISCWNQTHLRSKIPNVGILSAQHIAHVDNSNFYNNTHFFSQDFCFVIFQTSSPFFFHLDYFYARLFFHFMCLTLECCCWILPCFVYLWLVNLSMLLFFFSYMPAK